MKNRLGKSIISKFLLGIFAMSGAWFTNAYATEPITEKQTPDPMQFARGAKTWAGECGRCHNMRDPKELRDDQWRAVVSHMRVRAGLTGQESRDVLKFLQESN